MILGVHSSKKSLVLDDKKASKTLTAAIERDIGTLDLNAVQIFTHGPRNMKRNKFDCDDIIEATKEMDLTVHSAYTTVQIWKYKDLDKAKQKSVKEGVRSQLEACSDIEAWAWVLHVTKQPPETVAYVMNKVIKPIAKKYKITVALEMVASKAHKTLTYESPEKINRLTKLIPGNWWCWCVDTAHLWGAGVDIQSYKAMSEWLDGIKDKKRIQMFHLNGSSADIGSGKDKHEIAFEKTDQIWHGIAPAKSGLRAVVEFAKKHEVTTILEIKRGKQKDVESAIDIILDL